MTTPGVVTRDLGEGTWVIFQHTGTTRGGPGIRITTDPEDPARQRWWDGSSWTDRRT